MNIIRAVLLIVGVVVGVAVRITTTGAVTITLNRAEGPAHEAFARDHLEIPTDKARTDGLGTTGVNFRLDKAVHENKFGNHSFTLPAIDRSGEAEIDARIFAVVRSKGHRRGIRVAVDSGVIALCDLCRQEAGRNG